MKRVIRAIVILLFMFLMTPLSWGMEPSALEIYRKLTPLFAEGQIEALLKVWGTPEFEEIGAQYWRWGNGRLYCVIGKNGNANIGGYIENSDISDSLDVTLEKRYCNLKEDFVSILGTEDGEARVDMTAQESSGIMTVWEKKGRQMMLMCMYSNQQQCTTLQFLIRARQNKQ